MLFSNAEVTIARQSSRSTPYASGKQVYFHTRGLNEALQVQATGQPLHTFMSDNSPSPPAYARGDIVTFVRRLNSATLPPITTWVIDDIDTRGDFWPYLHIQLTSAGR